MFSFPRASSSEPLDQLLLRTLVLAGDDFFSTWATCLLLSSGTAGGLPNVPTSAFEGVPGRGVQPGNAGHRGTVFPGSVKRSPILDSDPCPSTCTTFMSSSSSSMFHRAFHVPIPSLNLVRSSTLCLRLSTALHLGRRRRLPPLGVATLHRRQVVHALREQGPAREQAENPAGCPVLFWSIISKGEGPALNTLAVSSSVSHLHQRSLGKFIPRVLVWVDVPVAVDVAPRQDLAHLARGC